MCVELEHVHQAQHVFFLRFNFILDTILTIPERIVRADKTLISVLIFRVEPMRTVTSLTTFH